MKILHTSDWHLGRSLYGRKRYDEFSAFLDWLADLIVDEGIDALLVAGDIFDTSVPGNRAQELYYRFLFKVSTSDCRHIVITAGNHDSPTFLNAPRQVLRALNVYVTGAITDNPEDEVITLYNESSKAGQATEAEAVICAVPYLRDRDIRSVEAGESVEDKHKKLLAGIEKHYADVCAIGDSKRIELMKPAIPLIAMGHLFTARGQTVDGDGVRELYVGSLAHIGRDAFPSSIDYLALGHLHVPQLVGGEEHIRYSGSPIPMGFGEATQQKSVVIVEFPSRGNCLSGKDDSNGNESNTIITTYPVPCFQELKRVSGNLAEITQQISVLKSENSNGWLEIEYKGKEIVPALREIIEEAVFGTAMEVLRIKNKVLVERALSQGKEEETLDDLTADEVFDRCLDANEIPEEQRLTLVDAYKEILQTLYDEDANK